MSKKVESSRYGTAGFVKLRVFSLHAARRRRPRVQVRRVYAAAAAAAAAEEEEEEEVASPPASPSPLPLHHAARFERSFPSALDSNFE